LEKWRFGNFLGRGDDFFTMFFWNGQSVLCLFVAGWMQAELHKGFWGDLVGHTCYPHWWILFLNNQSWWEIRT